MDTIESLIKYSKSGQKWDDVLKVMGIPKTELGRRGTRF